MPRLWSDTVQQHRHDVREAILDKAAALIQARGLPAVTMSQIAKDVGIGRATLYKYFNSVEEVIVAWHERQVTEHLEQLTGAIEREQTGLERLSTLIGAHARALHHHHDPALVLIDPHFPGAVNDALTAAQDRIRHLLVTVLTEGASTGVLRTDVPPEELANFVLHSLGAAADLPPADAVDRLVNMVIGALLPTLPNKRVER